MKTSWTKGLNREEQDEMENAFRASSLIRKRLDELLKEKLESSLRDTRSRTRYEDPSWAYYQADARGYERALVEISNLISSSSVENS